MHVDSTSLPTVGITIGDVAGIGPEIVLKALHTEPFQIICKVIIIGDEKYLRQLAAQLAIDIDALSVEILDLGNLPDRFEIGVDAKETGRASAEYIEAAVDLWRSGKIDAICTAPISKKAINLGGYDFPGHTEFLARLTNTEKFAMSFFAGDLRTVLLSTHLSLKDAIGLVEKDRLCDLIRFTSAEMGKLLGRKVKVAVAGLNPHASENGMFGNEELAEILPAIRACRNTDHIDVTGPYSPDTIFVRGSHGEFDVIVALYHDQATIAVKSLAFGSAVNVTLGLPLIRTSVDHGTAYDIAGKGIADPSSMGAALRLAAQLARQSPLVS